MSEEKPSPAPNSGDQSGRAGKNNRRRSMRSKRRGRKPGEAGEAAPPKGNERPGERASDRPSERSTGRGERAQPRQGGNRPTERPQERSPENQTGERTGSRSSDRNSDRSGGSRGGDKNDKALRENRERRRRRRMRTKQRPQNDYPTPVVEDNLADLPPLQPAFIYTHVVRPGLRDSYEFRTEHFSKVTRKLEDFHIDLSAIFTEAGGDEIQFSHAAPVNFKEIFSNLEREDEARAAAEAELQASTEGLTSAGLESAGEREAHSLTPASKPRPHVTAVDPEMADEDAAESNDSRFAANRHATLAAGDELAQSDDGMDETDGEIDDELDRTMYD